MAVYISCQSECDRKHSSGGKKAWTGKGTSLNKNKKCFIYVSISVVPTLAKILEKQVKIQLINYLSINRLLSPSQSAYLPKHSAETRIQHSDFSHQYV